MKKLFKEYFDLAFKSEENLKIRKAKQIIAFPFVLLFAGFICLAFLSIARSVNNIPDYKKNPRKYKKVYREGLLGTYTDYHEI